MFFPKKHDKATAVRRTSKSEIPRRSEMYDTNMSLNIINVCILNFNPNDPYIYAHSGAVDVLTEKQIVGVRSLNLTPCPLKKGLKMPWTPDTDTFVDISYFGRQAVQWSPLGTHHLSAGRGGGSLEYGLGQTRLFAS